MRHGLLLFPELCHPLTCQYKHLLAPSFPDSHLNDDKHLSRTSSTPHETLPSHTEVRPLPQSRRGLLSEGAQEVLPMEGLQVYLLPARRPAAAGHGRTGRSAPVSPDPILSSPSHPSSPRRLQNTGADQSGRKSCKKQEKYEATLVEQKRSYQRHLRSLQRKMRNESSQPVDPDFVSRQDRRRKCFGVESASPGNTAPASTRTGSWQPWTSPALSNANFWPPAQLFLSPVVLNSPYPSISYLPSLPAPKLIPTRVLQTDLGTSLNQKKGKKSSFCVESLLSQ